MDYRLLQRRNRPTDKGVEVWLVRIYDPDDPTTTLLAVTNNPGDIVYDGVSYTSYPLKWSSEDQGTDTGLPMVVLTISNILRALQPALYANDFFRLCECACIAYNTEELDVDYTSEIKTYLIVNHSTVMQDVAFSLSSSSDITDLIPPDIFNPYSCRHQFPNWENDFTGSRCGYNGVVISSIVLSGTDPILINATAHGLVSGELAFVRDITGITPEINGVYVVTRVNDNAITLDDTVSSDYGGTGSGGRTGYNECPRYKEACRIRGMITRFGATPNLRSDSLEVEA